MSIGELQTRSSLAPSRRRSPDYVPCRLIVDAGPVARPTSVFWLRSQLNSSSLPHYQELQAPVDDGFCGR